MSAVRQADGEHKQREVTAPYGERHPGFSPRAIRTLLARAGLDVLSSDVASREAKKPHFDVVLAVADKRRKGPAKGAKAG